MTEFNKNIGLAGGVLGVLIGCIIIFGLLALETYLVMVIWNNIIVKKFPNANIQELSFWDGLGLMVFISIMFPHTVVYASTVAKNIKV
jgi:uncharacterized membrane protein